MRGEGCPCFDDVDLVHDGLVTIVLGGVEPDSGSKRLDLEHDFALVVPRFELDDPAIAPSRRLPDENRVAST